MKYVYYGELQDYMEHYYKTTGKMLSFVSALTQMNQKGYPHEGTFPELDFSLWDGNDLDMLNQMIRKVAIPFYGALFLESDTSLPEPLIIFKYPAYSRAGVHFQDGLEFNYVYSGSCTMYFEGKTYTLLENEFYIIPPHTLHDVYDTENCIVFSFLIHQHTFNETFFQVLGTDSPLASFYRVCLTQTANFFLRFQIKDSRKFIHTFLNMLSEFHAQQPYYNEVCTNYIRILLSYLLRNPICNFKYDSEEAPRAAIEGLPLILHYIKNNYQTVTLNFLADFFHYDRSYLGKLIKRYTHTTFTELVADYRMEHAHQLLTGTSRTIEQIAELTGYNSADHFSRMFKKTYGIAPSKYRKENSAPLSL